MEDKKEMIGYFATLEVTPVGCSESSLIEIIVRKPADIDAVVKDFQCIASDFGDPYAVPVVTVSEAKRIIFREEE